MGIVHDFGPFGSRTLRGVILVFNISILKIKGFVKSEDLKVCKETCTF